MKRTNSADVRHALEQAKRTAGWNNRSAKVRRFDVPGGFGWGCVLYVVPYRRFAYNRREKATADYGCKHRTHGGSVV